MKLLQNSKIYHKFTESTGYVHLTNNLLNRDTAYYSTYETRVRYPMFDHKLTYFKITTVPNHTGVHNETA